MKYHFICPQCGHRYQIDHFKLSKLGSQGTCKLCKSKLYIKLISGDPLKCNITIINDMINNFNNISVKKKFKNIYSYVIIFIFVSVIAYSFYATKNNNQYIEKDNNFNQTDYNYKASSYSAESDDIEYIDENSELDENSDLNYDSELEDNQENIDDLRDRTENLNYEIHRLRRNADTYDRDTYERKLKNLQYDAEDLSAESSEVGADDASSDFDNSAYELRKARRSIEDEPSIFYREKNDDLDLRLKRSESSSEDALNNLEDP
jgi:hypothetical protein